MIGVRSGSRCMIPIAMNVLRHIGSGGTGEGARLGIVAEFRGKLMDAGEATERREIHRKRIFYELRLILEISHYRTLIELL